ncbi:MGDG synthase family glycosyltransferase [Paenibacillus sp.]|uniref:MGDG synthase family glycosyltransferase n=1 Tax=Paenibacillus sp. TaxID=58172 RepID=UPI002D6AB87E|nr:glycosyltransferase [Paenibacillus sp.]HZG57488.1 glycosyltransferase [Paenibacillus sp.]
MRPDVTSDRRKILILYASYGDGHIQVSRALKERFDAAGKYETVLVDLFAEAYPKLNELTKYIYIKSYTLFPRLYGWSYYSTREMSNDTWFSAWFHSWGMRKLKDVLKRERPVAVVNTFPMLAMPELRRKTGVAVPIFNVLTDYVLHWRWIHPLIDRYYVATDDLKDAMAAAGVPEHRIRATGIPLKSSFARVERTEALYAKYGLSPSKRTVLLMAGSYGVLQGLRDVCDALAKLNDVQILVVCGKNETLFASMREIECADIKVFGFMQQMHELMSLADTMVTKPGGITLTESIQCELPVILFRPVPGQERDNAEYLASREAAIIAYDDTQVTESIRSLLESPERRDRAVRAMAALKKPQSADTVVNDIQEALDAFHAESVVTAERRRMTSERIS